MHAKNKTKKEIDVLFVHPSGHLSDYNIPLGVIGLMNSLDCNKRGIMYFEADDNLIRRTKIIAMDCHWYFPLREIEKLAEKFKKVNPRVIIIVGGLTASIFADSIVKKYKVDFVVKGDAEIPFRLLIRNLLEQKDVSNVPNIVHRKFITPQSYYLTQKDFDAFDYVTIDWFPTLKKRMIDMQRILPFNYYEYPGVYPYLMVYKGCKYNCDFCYTEQNMQKEIFKRSLVARDPKMVINDLRLNIPNKNIKSVFVAADFINILGRKYAERIFAHKYPLNIFYEFEHFYTPIDLIDRMVRAFNRSFFTFIFDHPNYNPEMRFRYFLKVMDYCKQSTKKITIKLYLRSTSKQFVKKYFPSLSRVYSNIDYGYIASWFMPIPLLHKNYNDNKKNKYFNFWYKKVDKEYNEACKGKLFFLIKSTIDDKVRFQEFFGRTFLVASKYRSAAHYLQKAISNSQKNSEKYYQLVFLKKISLYLPRIQNHFKNKRYSEVITYASKIMPFLPKTVPQFLVDILYNTNILSLFGLAYERTGQYSKAIPILKTAKKLYPQDIKLTISLTNCYKKINQIKKGN